MKPTSSTTDKVKEKIQRVEYSDGVCETGMLMII